MNTRSSSHHGRAHRTMESAFGPYQRRGLVEECDPMPKEDRIIIAVSAIAAIVLLAFILVGWVR